MSLYLQPLLDLHAELIIDGFAGGGGASSGIEQALGRMVDIAINHDPAAIELHKANHPQTQHLVSDIFEVDPREVTQGRPVGFAWFSPDCTDHSKAKGGKPIRTRKRRSLAWVVVRWAGQVRPRVITLENVEEFKDWSPLVGKPGEYRRCPKRKGRTFRRFILELERLGYVVEHRELRACDYGAPTIRKRLYIIARCDGRPIVWPEPTHGAPNSIGVKTKHLKTYRTAAECIDWSIPMLSIFATKEEARAWGKFYGQSAPIRPLAENTQRRIARGVKRYVLDNPKPFLVTLNHGGEWQRGWSTEEPMRTLTASRDAHAVIAPHVTKFRSGSTGHQVDEPLHTVTSNSNDADHKGGSIPLGVVAPYLVPRYGEREGQEPRTRSIEDPAPVIVPDGNGGSLVAANLSTYHGDKTASDARGGLVADPVDTIDTQNRHAVVASFLGQFNGGFADGNSGDGHELTDPVSAISTKGPHQAVVAGFLDQCNNGFDNRVGRSLDDPQGTVCAQGSPQTLVASSMIKLKGTGTDADPQEPLDTINAGGLHHGIAAAHIQRDFGQSTGSGADEPVGTVTPNGQGKAALVASFLQTYYGTGTGQEVTDPLRTIPTLDNFGFVAVEIEGQPYYISDIAMRMLQPKELYAAQGFRPGYIIDRGADGRMLTKTEQVRMCGNSVCPPVAEALVRANVPEMICRKELRAS